MFIYLLILLGNFCSAYTVDSSDSSNNHGILNKSSLDDSPSKQSGLDPYLFWRGRVIYDVSFDNDLLDSQNVVLLKKLDLKNRIFSQELLDKAFSKIKNFYGELGYLNCAVKPVIKSVVSNYQHCLIICFKIDKGEQFKINRITVFGHDDPYDLALRKAINISSGDVVNTSLLNKIEYDIESMHRFGRQKLKWKITQVSPSLVNLDLDLGGESYRHYGIAGVSYTDYKGSQESACCINIDSTSKKLENDQWSLNLKLRFGKNLQENLLNASFIIPGTQDLVVGCYFRTELARCPNFARTIELNRNHFNFGFCVGYNQVFPADNMSLFFQFQNKTESFRNRYVKYQNMAYHPYLKVFDSNYFCGKDYNILGIKIAQQSCEDIKKSMDYWIWDAEVNYSKCLDMVNAKLSAQILTPISDDNKFLFSSQVNLLAVKTFSEGCQYDTAFSELAFPNSRCFVSGFRWGEAGPKDTIFGIPLGATKMFCLKNELIYNRSGEIFSMGNRYFVFYDVGALWEASDVYTKHIVRNDFNLCHSAGIGFFWDNVKFELGYKIASNEYCLEDPFMTSKYTSFFASVGANFDF